MSNAPKKKPALRLRSVRKNYGRVVAGAGVDLTVDEGERFVVRPEKIRMLAGGEPADPGMTVEPGTVEEVVCVGMSTRYVSGWTAENNLSRSARIGTPQATRTSTWADR